MSSTNRGAERRPDDFYSTPAWATLAILPHLDLSGTVLEPCAGDGAIVSVLRQCGVDADRISAIELDKERAKTCGQFARTLCSDFFDAPIGRYRLAITNPPYLLAQEFITRALGIADEVAMLLRLGFLGGQKRAAWHRAHPADVYVLPRRPSFTGHGTDSCDYGWFVWGARHEGRVHVL